MFVYCGLQNGDILIGAVNAPPRARSHSHSHSHSECEHKQREEEEEEQLIQVQHCHSTSCSSICGQLLGALISWGKDQRLSIWDLNVSGDGEAIPSEVSVLHSLTISTDGVTRIYPFRCYLSDTELLAVTTVEGIIYIYLLEEAQLVTILNADYQSEIVDISAMSDGIILSVSTLNGFIYLYDTVNFHQVSCQRLSAKPIIFAKYRKSNNDFMFIDYEGTYRMYPQTRSTTERTRRSLDSNLQSLRSQGITITDSMAMTCTPTMASTATATAPPTATTFDHSSTAPPTATTFDHSS